MLYPASWPFSALSIGWALLLAGYPVPASEGLIPLKMLCPELRLAMLPLSIGWALLLAGNPMPDSEGLICLEVLCLELSLAILPSCALFLSGEPVAEAEAEISKECLGPAGSSISVSDMSATSVPSAPSCGASASASLSTSISLRRSRVVGPLYEATKAYTASACDIRSIWGGKVEV